MAFDPPASSRRGPPVAARFAIRRHVDPDAASGAEWYGRLCFLAGRRSGARTHFHRRNFSVGNRCHSARFLVVLLHPTANHPLPRPSIAHSSNRTQSANPQMLTEQRGGSVVCSPIQHWTSRARLLAVPSRAAAGEAEVNPSTSKFISSKENVYFDCGY